MDNDKNIVIQDISCTINGARILNGISFKVNASDVVGIIGPNGAGKSTLVRLLVNIIKPDKGNIFINGYELSGIKISELYKKIAFIPQNLDFNFPFRVIDTVLMGRMPYLGRLGFEKDHDYQLAADAIDTVGMSGFTDREVTTLSGGEKQLVALAKAIAQQTDYLVLDEPISNLDINHQHRIMSYLRDMGEGGKGLIVVLHDLALAARYCTRLLVLDKGNMIEFDTPEKVLSGPLISNVFGVRAEVYRSVRSGSLIIDTFDQAE